LPASIESTTDSFGKLSIKGKSASDNLTPFAQMMADKIVSQESEGSSHFTHDNFGLPSHEVFRNVGLIV